MNVLVIDVGGTHIKCLATGQVAPRKFPSGPTLTAVQMVEGVKRETAEWDYEAISIGFPAPVRDGRTTEEPAHLGGGWLGFDFAEAFGRPVRMLNDAAMQALGSYEGGKMLFLGLGTGLGSALIIEGIVAPLEMGRLPYRKRTFEDYVGVHGLELFGKKKWREYVADVIARLTDAMQPTDVVLGGGNSKYLKELPPLCRLGSNANAFKGGFRMWNATNSTPTHTSAPARPSTASVSGSVNTASG
jgi:polyphosphate glucokinase